MKVAKLTITNFLSIGQASLALDDIGLVLVQGINNDNPSASSNGAGKSSIVDALSFGLFGETARGIGGDAIIRHSEKKASVSVQLLDEDTGVEYIIHRHRQKGKGTLTFESGSRGLTLGTEKLTQEAIIKTIGCSREVFVAAVYLGQEQMPDLPSMTDRKLKELIEEAAGVGILEAAYLKSREALLGFDKHLVACVAKETHGDAMLEAAKVAYQTAIDCKADWVKAEAERRDGYALGITGKLAEITDINLRTDADGFTHILDPFSVREIEENVNSLLVTLGGFAGEQKAERDAQSSVSVAEKQAASLEAKGQAIAAQLKRAVEAVAKVKAADTCDACGQGLPHEAHAHACDAAANTLAERRSEAGKALTELKAARLALAEQQAALATLRAGMSDPSELQKDLEVARSALNRHNQALAEIETLNHQIETLQQEIAISKITVSPFEAMLSDGQKAIETAAVNSLALKAATQMAIENVDLYKGVVGVFGPAGVRAHVLDQVTPYLNEQTQTYLDMLSDGTLKAVWSTLTRSAKGELREKFAIEVQHPAGEGFGAISGGEKQKVRIACALALQDLVASRATKPFKLWLADEVDSALDDAGLERLMEVLREKAREKGTVLVISHRDLRDWIPNVWTVTKTGNNSEVTV